MPNSTKTKTKKTPTKPTKKVVTPRASRRQVSPSPPGVRQPERWRSQLPNLEKVLRGSLVTRYRRCGHPNCHCARKGDPGHGPSYYLMVTIGPGKTVQVYIPRDQKREVEVSIKNFRRARQILERISTANRKLLQQGRLFQGG